MQGFAGNIEELSEKNSGFRRHLNTGKNLHRTEDVVMTQESICRHRGYPRTIRVDQGSEFVPRDLDLWAYAKCVILDFSRPGKPTGNSFAETFNGKDGHTGAARLHPPEDQLLLASTAAFTRAGVNGSVRNRTPTAS